MDFKDFLAGKSHDLDSYGNEKTYTLEVTAKESEAMARVIFLLMKEVGHSNLVNLLSRDLLDAAYPLIKKFDDLEEEYLND